MAKSFYFCDVHSLKQWVLKSSMSFDLTQLLVIRDLNPRIKGLYESVTSGLTEPDWSQISYWITLMVSSVNVKQIKTLPLIVSFNFFSSINHFLKTSIYIYTVRLPVCVSALWFLLMVKQDFE